MKVTQIALAVLALLMMKNTELIYDFGSTGDGSDWVVVSDGVMGGRSEGSARLTANSLIFTGKVSLENNGGFSSVRAPYGRYDLSACTHVFLKYRSKGMDMAITLATSRAWYQPNFKANIPDTNGNWETLELPLDDIDRYRIGRPIGGKLGNSDRSAIVRFGFITNEKKYGSFEFEIDSLIFR
jgi:hypothetical protein